MWACTWYWYLQQGLKCFLFSSLQARGLDIGCFTRTAASTARSSVTLLQAWMVQLFVNILDIFHAQILLIPGCKFLDYNKMFILQ